MGLVAVLTLSVGCRKAAPTIEVGPADSGPVVAALPIGAAGGNGAVSKCPERADAWGANLPVDFVMSVQNDCRIEASVFPPAFRTADQVSAYLNALHAWAMDFLGCGALGGEGGVDDYGLLPTTQRNQAFTTADTDLLTSHFLAAMSADLQKSGVMALPPARLESLRADLARRASRLPHIRASANYSAPSACPPDAGAPR